MKKFVTVAAIMSIAIMIVGVVFFLKINDVEDASGGYAVTLNEIENQALEEGAEGAAQSAKELREQIRRDGTIDRETDYTPLILSGICVLFLAGSCTYLYVSVIKPMGQLSEFADKVGGGDLDTPIPQTRGGMFGKFTWALDSMRNEIKKARACEQEAIENNKTVIATLSHDIKTPISTISAYAEALDMGMDIDSDKHGKYVNTILKKCDEVRSLTEDMLTHALTELGHLKMNPEVFELGSFAEELIADLNADRGDVAFTKPVYSLEINADKKRIAQVIENIIANARKYAKTAVDVKLVRDGKEAVMTFADKGGGIPDEDMPFVLGKFYRGSNSSEEQGAGLGLFIVNYIVEQSGGKVLLANKDGGLEVTVRLPITE